MQNREAGQLVREKGSTWYLSGSLSFVAVAPSMPLDLNIICMLMVPVFEYKLLFREWALEAYIP